LKGSCRRPLARKRQLSGIGHGTLTSRQHLHSVEHRDIVQQIARHEPDAAHSPSRVVSCLRVAATKRIAYHSLGGRPLHSLVETHRAELIALCWRFKVRRLELFGSAAGQASDRSLRDLDFLVVFESSSPGEHANRYFGLLEALEALFGRPIDLVELSAIRNPYFMESIEASRTPLYAA
jgi:uncharacterized protein